MSDDDSIELDADESVVEASSDTAGSSESETVTTADSGSSLALKTQEREKIQSDIEAFLASGGKINSIDSNVVADPPKKPSSSYGSQPI